MSARPCPERGAQHGFREPEAQGFTPEGSRPDESLQSRECTGRTLSQARGLEQGFRENEVHRPESHDKHEFAELACTDGRRGATEVCACTDPTSGSGSFRKSAAGRGCTTPAERVDRGDLSQRGAMNAEPCKGIEASSSPFCLDAEVGPRRIGPYVRGDLSEAWI